MDSLNLTESHSSASTTTKEAKSGHEKLIAGIVLLKIKYFSLVGTTNLSRSHFSQCLHMLDVYWLQYKKQRNYTFQLKNAEWLFWERTLPPNCQNWTWKKLTNFKKVLLQSVSGSSLYIQNGKTQNLPSDKPKPTKSSSFEK